MLNGAVYGYLVGFLVVSVLGMFIQFTYFNKKDEKDENKEKKKEDDSTIDVETKKPLMSTK
jgi:hypothetical protein